MKTIVIGGGAAGMTAAITAAENKNQVTVIEHQNQIGRKINITGNGHCNISNLSLDSSKYYGDKDFIHSVLEKINTDKIISFFEDRGLMLFDKNGYLYPLGMQASTVTDFLRETALNNNVKIKTNNEIKSIKHVKDKYVIDIGIELECDKLIVATGGKSFANTGSDGSGYNIAKNFGHKISLLKPALTALVLEKCSLNKASGVRIQGKVSNVSNSYTGELQITDYGISGIPVFNLSRTVEENSYITIDFMPGYTKKDLKISLINIFNNFKNQTVTNSLHYMFNEKIALFLTKECNLEKVKCKDITDIQFEELLNIIKNYKVKVLKTRGFDYAQVTAGGVDVTEVDKNTMESKIHKNLYFAGEILDVDGICGGYNLHFAWATGILAGGCKG